MSIWFKDYSDIDFGDAAKNIDKSLGIEFLELGENFFKANMPVDEELSNR